MKIKKIKINYKKIIPKIEKVLYGVIFAFLVIVAGVVAISAFKIPGNYKLLAVQSGSMEPSIKTGSVVIVKPFNDYKKGDVITVVEPANPKVSLTHRIIEVKESNGKVSYITKGDANKTSDTEERLKENVVGKVIFSVPFVGYPVSFAKTRDGLLILIIIPATIIVYSELLKIKKEAQRLLKERKKRKLTEKEKLELEIGEEEIVVERGIKRFVKKIFPFLILFLILNIKPTGAYLNDSESISVSATAGTWEVEKDVKLDLYWLDFGKVLGFKLSGSDLPDYSKFEYELTYDTDQTLQGANGTRDIEGRNEIVIDNFVLGSASSGSMIYYTNIHDINLKVKLINGPTSKELSDGL